MKNIIIQFLQDSKKRNYEAFKHTNLFECRGAYNVDRYNAKNLYESIYVDEVIYSEKHVNEDMDSIPQEMHGGIITFSTAMNSTELTRDGLINHLKRKMTSLKNQFQCKFEKIDETAGKFELACWAIAKGLHCRYKDRKTGTSFDENSISVELVGISNDTLLNFAKELCIEFEQQTALVKASSTLDIWLSQKGDHPAHQDLAQKDCQSHSTC